MFDPVMDRQTPDKKLFVAAGSSVTATLNQRHIIVSGASGSTTDVTFPNVSEAEGLRFLVTGLSLDTGGIVTFNYTNGGAASLTTNLSTTGIELSFESNGVAWLVNRTT